MKKFIFLVVSLAFLLVFNVLKANENSVKVYKQATCGCCAAWSQYMTKNGYKVEVINVEDILGVKEKHNIPENMYSCHTAVIGNLVVEGHVPVNVIKKALSDANVSKIAVPGMPAGSPGMPGTNANGYNVYTLDENGNASVYYKVK